MSTSASSNANPPARRNVFSAAGALIRRFKRQQHGAVNAMGNAAARVSGVAEVIDGETSQWREVEDHVDACIVTISDSLPAATPEEEVPTAIRDVLRALQQLRDAARAGQQQSFVRKVAAVGRRDLRQPSQMRADADAVVQRFQLSSNVAQHLELCRPSRPTMEQLAQSNAMMTLSQFPMALGTSWNPMRTCLSGTRRGILSDVQTWIKEPNSSRGAAVLLLEGGLGCGKTTIAHSAAQQAHQAGQLLMAYFRAHSVSASDTAAFFVSTLIRHIAAKYQRAGALLTSSINADASLITAPAIRQLQTLVIHPGMLAALDSTHPQVIVVDGVTADDTRQEGLGVMLLELAAQLPSSFRILVTARPITEIGSTALSKQVNISARFITEDETREDIEAYIEHRLPEVMQRLKAQHWNRVKLRKGMSDLARDSFLWARTALDFLKICCDPDAQLERLLAGSSSAGATKQMDDLYEQLLDDLPWYDEDFRAGYGQCMGFILEFTDAQPFGRPPMSLFFLGALVDGGTAQVVSTCQALGALLIPGDATGKTPLKQWFWDEKNLMRPVQLCHPSLRDYLRERAPGRYCLPSRETSPEFGLRTTLLFLRGLEALYEYMKSMDTLKASMTLWNATRDRKTPLSVVLPLWLIEFRSLSMHQRHDFTESMGPAFHWSSVLWVNASKLFVRLPPGHSCFDKWSRAWSAILTNHPLGLFVNDRILRAHGGFEDVLHLTSPLAELAHALNTPKICHTASPLEAELCKNIFVWDDLEKEYLERTWASLARASRNKIEPTQRLQRQRSLPILHSGKGPYQRRHRGKSNHVFATQDEGEDISIEEAELLETLRQRRSCSFSNFGRSAALHDWKMGEVINMFLGVHGKAPLPISLWPSGERIELKPWLYKVDRADGGRTASAL